MNLVGTIGTNLIRLPSNGGSATASAPAVNNNNAQVNNQDANFVMPTNDDQSPEKEEQEVTHAVKKHSFLQTLKNWVEGTISFVDAGFKLASKWCKQAWGAASDKLPYLLAIVPAILVALFLGKDAINKSTPNLQNNKKSPVTM